MKNKLGITAAAALVAISLAACSNENNQSSSRSSDKPATSQVEKKQNSSTENSSNTHPRENKTSSENKSTSNSSENKSSSEDKKPSSQAPERNRMEKMTAKLRKALPGMLLPTRDGLGTGSDNLNVRYTKNGNTNTVYYSVGNSPAEFNAPSVKNEKPFAVLTETKNSEDPDGIINYMPAQKGLPTTKLDADTTATTQGAAGQSYLQWNKGDWSYVIQASTQLKENPTDRGKSVLKLVNEYGVPSTSSHGSVHVTMGDSLGSLNTVIAWQKGNSTYQLKAHDTTTAFKMLNSLK